MSLNQPDYITVQNYGGAFNLIIDSKNNFKIIGSNEIRFDVWDNNIYPFIGTRSSIYTTQVFLNCYELLVNEITIELSSFVEVIANGYTVHIPMPDHFIPNSQPFFNILSFTRNILTPPNATSKSESLYALSRLSKGQKLINNLTPYAFNIYPFTSINNIALNNITLKVNTSYKDYADYYFAQNTRGFYFSQCSGVESPLYGINCGTTGNGLLDMPFNLDLYTPTGAASEHYNYGYQNGLTGCYTISTANNRTDPALSGWSYTLNIQISGKILK